MLFWQFLSSKWSIILRSRDCYLSRTNCKISCQTSSYVHVYLLRYGSSSGGNISFLLISCNIFSRHYCPKAFMKIEVSVGSIYALKHSLILMSYAIYPGVDVFAGGLFIAKGLIRPVTNSPVLTLKYPICQTFLEICFKRHFGFLFDIWTSLMTFC